MIWPTKKEYNIAIENWRTTLSNPDLRKGQLARNKHGKIFPLGGANHYVTLYKFDNQDKTHSWVVRCFCTKRNEQNPFEIIDQPPDDIKARYKTLHDFCRSDTGKKISALVRVDYLENEITVGEWKYPIAKMDFLSALNLGEFIAENYQDRATMQQLGEAWKRMMCELEEVRIAHGDLDLTNVLVERQASALRLRLIDYDSFWVPSLGNSDQPVYGHQSFQHPGFFRIKKRPDNAEMDRFSALVIYLSIAMLTLRPELYFKCGANEVDRLLFSPEDYEQPDGGRIMEFRRLSLPGTHKYIDELRMALHNNLMPRPLSVIGGREPTSNQLYTPQPPTLDWDKLILNPRVAPYSPSTQPANPLPSPTPKPKGASQTSIINFLVDLVIFQLISLLLIAIGFGVFFLLKAIGVIATLPKMHNFSGTQYILAAFVALFSFSGNSPTIRSMLENLALPSLDYLVLIALVSNLISLILYILVRRRIHSMVHSQSPQYESPKQSPELLQYSTRATLIEPSWAADISQPSHQEEVLASGSQFVEFSPSIDPVISQPESTFLHDNHTEPEHLSQHTIQQSSLQIREGGIEIRLKEACSQLAQGKSDSVIKLAIEIQLSYYEFWAKLMDAVANTSTEYMNVNTRRWASQMLKDGNTAPDTNKALKC